MSLIEDLKRHEGLRLKPYKDTVGKLTIGVGRNLDDVGISEQEADMMLRNDINIAISEANSAFPWLVNLSDARKDVIYNMAFNMGLPTLRLFTNTIGHIKRKDFDLAADEMTSSKWARQVGIRATELSNIMRGD